MLQGWEVSHLRPSSGDAAPGIRSVLELGDVLGVQRKELEQLVCRWLGCLVLSFLFLVRLWV